MLSTAALYALRAMVCLAERPDLPQTSRDISEQVGIQSEYLAKVLGTLSRAGLVSSRRGRGGGFTLRREPKDISLFDVVAAIEPLNRIEEEVLQPDARDRTGKRLRDVVDTCVKDVTKRLGGSSLSDIAVKKRR
jgi:Rrf2 family protein